MFVVMAVAFFLFWILLVAVLLILALAGMFIYSLGHGIVMLVRGGSRTNPR